MFKFVLLIVKIIRWFTGNGLASWFVGIIGIIPNEARMNHVLFADLNSGTILKGRIRAFLNIAGVGDRRLPCTVIKYPRMKVSPCFI